ncbi:TIM-barrel domain-containing protein [Phyllobacterium endophyticum]|uniref:TIM-barrel domain-containing protein n=1 Tax=Phyllobacterium endophyticum TaxID=1149773 RepID=UPI0011CCC3B3|nr:TIM-barrel domain-containing protein [Phyllobacterium endophyticum]TXR48078.1 DUF5110 domain-containing protein [Phyllobacterium endophyticum]
MNRIHITALGLLLLPGLANCNGKDSHAPQNTSQIGGSFELQKGEPGEKGQAGDKGIAGDKGPAGDKGATGDKGETPAELTAVRPINEDTITPRPGGFDVQLQNDVLEVRAVASNAFRVHFLPDGVATSATRVIDPSIKFDVPYEVKSLPGKGADLIAGQNTARWIPRTSTIEILNGAKKVLMSLKTEDLKNRDVIVRHDPEDTLYGVNSDGAEERSENLYRDRAQDLKAGRQGHAGAPFVWSTAGYGVLVDTMGSRKSTVNLANKRYIDFTRNSKPDVDAYLMVGTPFEIFGAMAKISGRTPLFPKWAMGFTNSQWGADDAWNDKRNGSGQLQGMTEPKFRNIIKGYRERNIPIDAFTFDLDWTYWGGMDSSGTKVPNAQFQWNTERFPGMGPNRPQNADDNMRLFAEQQGIKLTAILKPRVAVDSEEGNFLKQNDYWMPTAPIFKDYFTSTQMRHVDFAKPAVRSWYFGQLKNVFDGGIKGWWNDEADSSEATDEGNETEGLDMQRGLYDGQRAISNERVWSINRNFYLGAQRHAHGLWSGDIDNGFESMALQRQRMLSAINAGAQQWTMDGGGFRNGKGTLPGGGTGYEDYARWVQFAAFTPIFRVHGDNAVQRQPWYYSEGEAPAVAAIQLRYKLIPYIYSYEHQRRKNGVGLVRPLLFDWPNDENVRNHVDSWMFGEWLMVSPVVQQGQKDKWIYYPEGKWIDWRWGAIHEGGKGEKYGLNNGWTDLPLFIRQGAIIPMQPDMQYVGEKPLTQLDIEVYPDTKRTSFEYYNDDGKTYDYENGVYFSQLFSAQKSDNKVEFETAAAEGRYKPETEYYLVKIYGSTASAVSVNGQSATSLGTLDALKHAAGPGWAAGNETAPSTREGLKDPVTYIRIKAGEKQNVVLTTR